jgi:hypothetical protein
MGPYAVVDYNLILSQLKCRLQHIYHVQPYVSVDLTQSRLYPPVRDLGFGLWTRIPSLNMDTSMATR